MEGGREGGRERIGEKGDEEWKEKEEGEGREEKEKNEE